MGLPPLAAEETAEAARTAAQVARVLRMPIVVVRGGRRLMGRHINLQRRQPHLTSDTRRPARALVSAGDAKWEIKETPFDFKRNQFMVIYPFLETSTPIQNTLHIHTVWDTLSTVTASKVV